LPMDRKVVWQAQLPKSDYVEHGKRSLRMKDVSLW